MSTQEGGQASTSPRLKVLFERVDDTHEWINSVESGKHTSNDDTMAVQLMWRPCPPKLSDLQHFEREESRGRLRLVEAEGRLRELLHVRRGSLHPPIVPTKLRPPSPLADVASDSSLSSIDEEEETHVEQAEPVDLAATFSDASFSMSFTISNFAPGTAAAEQLVENTEDLDEVLLTMAKKHATAERRRERELIAVMYRKKDNRFDADRRRKVEAREVDRRADIEMLEVLWFSEILRKHRESPFSALAAMQADERRIRQAIALREATSWVKVMRRVGVSAEQQQVDMTRGIVELARPGYFADADDDEFGVGELNLASTQSSFFVPATVVMDPSTALVLRGAQLLEQKDRAQIEASERSRAQLLRDSYEKLHANARKSSQQRRGTLQPSSLPAATKPQAAVAQESEELAVAALLYGAGGIPTSYSPRAPTTSRRSKANLSAARQLSRLNVAQRRELIADMHEDREDIKRDAASAFASLAHDWHDTCMATQFFGEQQTVAERTFLRSLRSPAVTMM